MSQYILNVDPEEAPAVLRLMLDSRDMFARSGDRPGWGWSLMADNGKSYFVRQTKHGLSARPAKKWSNP